MLAEPKNQFSLTRAALSTCGRAKREFLSVVLCLFALLTAPLQADVTTLTLTPRSITDAAGIGLPPALTVTYDSNTQKFSGFTFAWDGVGFDLNNGGRDLFDTLKAALDPNVEIVTFSGTFYSPQHVTWNEFCVIGQDPVEFAEVPHGILQLNYGDFSNGFSGVSGSPTTGTRFISWDGDRAYGIFDVTTPQVPEPYPLILHNEPGFGLQSNRFGFTISWATNLSVVVQASTNLSNPVWTPLATNPLVNGTNYFSDPNWTNYPRRFYRVATP